MNKLIASSSDPKQISLTLQGALIAIVPLVAMLIKQFGGQTEGAIINEIIKVAGDIIVAVGSLASLIMMFVGLIRRLANTFGK